MPGRWIEFDRLRLMKKYMYKNIYIYIHIIYVWMIGYLSFQEIVFFLR